MIIGLGTLINIVGIIAGSTVGVLAGSRLAVKTRDLITDVLGLITILAAFILFTLCYWPASNSGKH